MSGHGPGPIDPGFDPADPEYGLTPPGSTYEHTDAHTWLIAKFMFWLLVTAIVTHIGLGFFYQMLVEQGDRRDEGSLSYPLAAERTPRLPPLPRLQAAPGNELYEFRREEGDLINSYGWENKAMGTVHIPIAEAMRLTVARGLPARAVDMTEPGEDSALMPSDASAGRVMERRRQ